jgi:hypothetical protein
MRAAPRSQADISFQRDIKTAKAAVAEQQRYEAEWNAYHASTSAAVAKATHDKKVRNYQQREWVQYDNWHKPMGH